MQPYIILFCEIFENKFFQEIFYIGLKFLIFYVIIIIMREFFLYVDIRSLSLFQENLEIAKGHNRVFDSGMIRIYFLLRLKYNLLIEMHKKCL